MADDSVHAPAAHAQSAQVKNLLGLRDADAEDIERADVVLFGVPTDAGTEGRPGAAKGPAQVRCSSWTFGSYNHALGVDILEDLTVVDGGDLPISDHRLDAVLTAVQTHTNSLARGGQIPGMVGGTQALTLGALRGIVQAKRRPITLIHLTATHSLRRTSEGESGMLRRAQEEQLLKSGGVLQIGVRGPSMDGDESKDYLRAGFERLSVDNVRWDVHASVDAVRKVADGTSVYVSVDMSCLDPSACPGVTRPSPGGLTSWETQQVLRSLVGSDILGFDVVGLCPDWDTSELGTIMAVGVMHELLSVITEVRDTSRVSLIAGSVGRNSA